MPPWCLPGCPKVLSCLPGASWCLAGCPIGPFLPPWCLPGCPKGPFLPFWHLPGASQAVPNGPFLPPWQVPPRLSQMPPWCLPGASLVPRGLSKWSFPARWCLPGASPGCPKVLSCLVPPRCRNAFLQPPGCPSKGFRGADSSSKGPRGLAARVDSRFWTGAGFCLNFSTTSMANGPVRGKSWGGPHGRLPVAQAGL